MRYVENLDDTVTDHTGGGDIHALSNPQSNV